MGVLGTVTDADKDTTSVSVTETSSPPPLEVKVGRNDSEVERARELLGVLFEWENVNLLLQTDFEFVSGFEVVGNSLLVAITLAVGALLFVGGLVDETVFVGRVDGEIEKVVGWEVVLVAVVSSLRIPYT